MHTLHLVRARAFPRCEALLSGVPLAPNHDRHTHPEHTEDALMNSMPSLARRNSWTPFVISTVVMLMTLFTTDPNARAQGTGQTGSIGGRVLDERGTPVVSAQVFIDRTTLGTLTRADGSYNITQVPEGTHLVRTRLIGFRPESASVQ